MIGHVFRMKVVSYIKLFFKEKKKYALNMFLQIPFFRVFWGGSCLFNFRDIGFSAPVFSVLFL